MRSVLITGASGGIGSACAELFAQSSYAVAVCYRSNAEAAERLCRKYPNCFPIQADITKPGDLSRLLSLCEYHLSGLDVLVNNAAIAYSGVFDAMSAGEIKKVLDTDLYGAMELTRQALPLLRQSTCARIINVSSMWGVCGGSCEVAYSAAKSGLIGFTKALARELGPSGVTVNCVAPGYIDTPMNAAYSAETVASIVERTPLCRIGQPCDVAQAVLFLASEAASFITAQILGVDGGII